MQYSKGDILKIDSGEVWIVLNSGVSRKELAAAHDSDQKWNILWIWADWNHSQSKVRGPLFGVLSITSLALHDEFYQIIIGDQVYWSIEENISSIPMEIVKSEG